MGHSFVSMPDRKRRRNDQDDGGYVPAQMGGFTLWGFVQAHDFN